jgi:hypothetical protein
LNSPNLSEQISEVLKGHQEFNNFNGLQKVFLQNRIDFPVVRPRKNLRIIAVVVRLGFVPRGYKPGMGVRIE